MAISNSYVKLPEGNFWNLESQHFQNIPISVQNFWIRFPFASRCPIDAITRFPPRFQKMGTKSDELVGNEGNHPTSLLPFKGEN